MATRRQAPRANAPKYGFSINPTRGIIFTLGAQRLATFKFDRMRTLSCSCGVMEANGLSRLNQVLRQHRIPEDLAKKAFKQYVAVVKRYKRAAWLVLSNNTGAPIANAIVTSLAKTTTTGRRNPGSGNAIKVWTL